MRASRRYGRQPEPCVNIDAVSTWGTSRFAAVRVAHHLLASIITIFSDAQLFSLGIIGEYLTRTHFRMMERPPYVVSGHVGAATPADER